MATYLQATERGDLPDLYHFERQYLREEIASGDVPKAKIIKLEGTINPLLHEFADLDDLSRGAGHLLDEPNLGQAVVIGGAPGDAGPRLRQDLFRNDGPRDPRRPVGLQVDLVRAGVHDRAPVLRLPAQVRLPPEEEPGPGGAAGGVGEVVGGGGGRGGRDPPPFPLIIE